jgi:serine/threonine protein kinase
MSMEPPGAAAAKPANANPDAPVPYVFGGEIARGGMGCILETEDCKLGRKVAVKIMLWEMGVSDEQKQRFINEAAVLGMLEHPNIVPIHDLGRDSEGQLFYSMKLVKGRTLQAILNDIRKERGDAAKQFTLDRLLTIFRKICDAMAFAHSRGIIHRDLKPENVMVGEFGEALVMDWGIAKNFHEPGMRDAAASPGQRPATQAVGLTMEGVIMGSPNYMSPEQAGGRMTEMDARSDIFSLGGILYAILTLRPPVEGTTLDEVLRKVTSGSITPPASFGTTTGKPKTKGAILEAAKIKPLPHCPGGRVPAALSAVTMKALALKRENRYQNVAAFATDVEAYQNGFATSAENAGAWKQLTLLIKRHKAAAAAIAASLLLLAGISTAFTARLVNERNIAVLERQRAETERANAITERSNAVAERKNAEDQRLKAEEQRLRAESESKRAQQALAEAKAEKSRAISESMRAEQAMGDLKMTAPTILALARARLSEGKFEDAIKQIDAALQLDASNADYHLLRANTLELWLKLDDAIKEYQRVLTLRPGDRVADANIILCRQLAGEAADKTVPRAKIQHALLAACKQQQREMDAAALEKVMKEADDELGEKLDQLGESVLMKKKGQRVFRKPDGSLRVVLDHLNIRNLSIIEGQWISDLSLNHAEVSNLHGLPAGFLKYLSMVNTKVADIALLRGQPLESLTLDKSPVADLTALKDLPLAFLSLCYTKVTELTPLSGCISLVTLDLSNTRVTNLTPLIACRALKRLVLNECQIINLAPLETLQLTEFVYNKGPFNVEDAIHIAPLRVHPLVKLSLGGTRVADFHSLRGNATLEEITLPYLASELQNGVQLDSSPSIQTLRHFPQLKNIIFLHGISLYPYTYGAFWKAVARGDRVLGLLREFRYR